ncbi:MAG: arylsulfatase [Planctomycetota bacterium]|nr:arylsulfatase [Planctomycetota bacterium]
MRPDRMLLTTALLLGNTVFAAEAPRPNIVVILVDDMGWSDIGCYGSEIPTPHLDALAEHGVRFTQFYNTGRCSPTRASLLTGHYPHQAGMGHLDNNVKAGHPGFQGKISDTSVTIPEVLATVGYFTAMTGKWHLGQQHGTPPWKRGFQRSLNLQAGGIHFSNQGGTKGKGAKLYLNGEEFPINDPRFGDWYGSHLWAEWGLKFIDEALAEDKPFFLYLAHCAPHFPLMAPEADIARYRGKYLVGWDALREDRYHRQVELGLIDPTWGLTPRDEKTPAWDSVSPQERERFDDMMAIYAAMIDTIDQSTGMLVEGLRSRGILDNTLLMFLSDNGGNAEAGPNGRYEGDQPGGPESNVFVGQNWATLNNTPFRKWKHYVHEGGSATPLIVHWPDRLAASAGGRLESQPSHLIDIMATVVDVAGADYPTTHDSHAIEPMEGVSLVPLLDQQPFERRHPIFFNHEDNRAVRDGPWKLVALKGQPWELYDMQTDRTELHDLAAQHPDLVAKMSDQYEDWARRTHVVVDGTADKPAPRQPRKRKKAAANQ